ncbi:MAG: TPR end-of-group domain-containing protein, partial [Planctomycetota bacterium]
MKRLIRTAGVAAVLLVTAGVAQAQDGELADRIRSVMRGKRYLSSQTSPKEAEQPRVRGDQVLHPRTGEVLEVLFLKRGANSASLRTAALYSAVDNVFWTFAWRAGESPVRIVNGPYKLEADAPVERGQVEDALRALIPPDGDVGFFDGMFVNLQKLGHGSVPHLLTIARGAEYDYTMRNLAIEALGETARKSDLPEIEKLARGNGYQGDARFVRPLSQAAVYVMHKLGDSTILDEQIKQLKSAITRGRRMGARPAQLGQAFRDLAIRYLRKDDYPNAIATYRQAIQADPDNRGINYYNLACAYSLANRVDEGLTALEQAVKEGYKGFEWMKRDGDLKN